MKYLLFALVSGFASLLLQPLIIKISRKKNWFDKPDERKIHTTQISRLGGIGIFVSFLISFSAALIFSQELLREFHHHFPVLISMVIIFAIGLLDDFFNVRALVRFVIQVAVALVLALLGYKFTTIWLPGLDAVNLGWLSYPITILWIVGVINAINMIDGMDGLCGGISLIALFSFGLILIDRNQILGALTAIILAGAIVGYLFYNFPPAKIFMGDSGSNLLGFTLAILPLMEIESISRGTMVWIAPTILLLPIFDVFAAMLRRIRQGKSIMAPDKWHIHHKLLHLGFSTRSILAIIYSTCMVLGAVGILELYLNPIVHWFVLVASWCLLFLLFIILHYLKEKSVVSS
ncbi:MAG TPA: MraY family glycosyltransferase [Spirochaetales bacterium]|nr:MraY family glycosyltransferase [Spirochaetales bacterium]